jgi:fatty-acyl-CoA synthase
MAAHPRLATLADVEAYEQVAFARRYPVQSGYELLLGAGAEFGDDPALKFLLTAEQDEPPEVVSYRQLARNITRTANALHALGTGPGDAVAMLLGNLPQTWYCVWGAQAAGIANPINPLLEAGHIAEILNVTTPKVLVVLAPLLDNSAYWEKVSAVADRVPSLHTLLVITVPGYTQETAGPLRRKLAVVAFDAAIARQPYDRLVSCRRIAAAETAAWFHTGGTTGRPKIARVSHGSIAFIAQLCRDISAYRGRYVCMSALPLFHIYGLISAGIGAVVAGRCIVMMTPSGFRTPAVLKNWWHHAARFEVEAFASVPTILAALLAVPKGSNDLSHLKDVGSGAAPLPPQLQEDFRRQFGVRVTNGYGMTETTCLISRALPEQPPPPGSVGVRIPYSEVRIVEIAAGKVVRECGPGTPGMLITRGPHLFQGYLDPEDNAKAWVDGDWFVTGDLAYIDAAGFLYVTGRARELIIRGGHNIDPLLIEEPLSRHPAVAEVAAIGQPDPYAGEVPVAYVRLRSTAPGTGEAELLDWCRTRIGEQAAIPKRVEILQAMPVTAAGKIFKPELINRATEHALRHSLQEAGVSATVSARFDPRRGQIAAITAASAQDGDRIGALLRSYPLVLEIRSSNDQTAGDRNTACQ